MSKSIISEAFKSLPAKTPEGHKHLFKALTKHITKDHIGSFEPDLIAEMVRTHWELSKIHVNDKSQTRIYCPLSKEKNIRKTVIDIVSDDMAFLVDSVAAEINRHNLLIELILHPLIYVKYGKKNVMLDISQKPKKGYIRQSHIHVHIREAISQDVIKKLESGLSQALSDVTIANRDWPKMLVKLNETREELLAAKTKTAHTDVKEYAAFLDYLHDNNFTLLGYREYTFKETKTGLKSNTVKGKSLGLLHDGVEPAYINESKEGLSDDLQKMRRKLPIISISKTNRLATVHRRVPMDAVSVKTHDAKGKVIGEKLFLGLFTSVTYSRSVADVPYLREKVETVMKASKFTEGSHDYKALRHILEKYPRDELFQIEPKRMLKTALDILSLQERQRIALFTRRDPFRRYISCLVYVPRDRFGTDLRLKMAKILERELDGTCTSFNTTMDDSLFARVMFVISVNQKESIKFNQNNVENMLREAGRTWFERLSSAMQEQAQGTADVTATSMKYAEAFPVEYTYRYSAAQALQDIAKTEETLKTNTMQLDLYQADGDKTEAKQMRLKVYVPGQPLTLSDVMPILRHMGIRALSELPYEVSPADEDQSVWIHDFSIEISGAGKAIDLKKVKTTFEEAFTKIWYKQMDSDYLNALVLRGGMGWRDVTAMRAFVSYLKQIRYPFGRLFLEKTLSKNPKISRALVKYFKALHDPSGDKDETAEKQKRKIKSRLREVESLDEDKIIRTLFALIGSTLRTNYYQTQDDGTAKSYLSIKFDCSKVPDLPAPRPYREVFVYSPRMEGIHLRGDKIARGGIRWSDRHEDYRTEVLGLMKAQMVKNSVIVPMGAKGGFILKRPPTEGGRQAFYNEGVECYKLLVRGLLDITDNRKGDKIIYPKNVVRRDGDDPYLVVAADKGTASFSDTANGLSQEYGFWLDDAFASGGSAGYDHKVMGITAKGGWESVKMHFRQLNHNTQEQPFEVIGVGDMGGDVFGNGMLLSEHIRLVGAFNHLHIFCDPDPNTAKSFKERQRLFDGVMGWDQYNEELLSKGGRIFSRKDKTLELTPEIQAAFGVEKKKISPPELMHAMLKARTDLLWFGGIGTYIKATDESHLDVGDKSNDDIRVNAPEVNAKVIGEGANLGITQSARIELEQAGVKLNTDFIDNSGGVDSSDHEVNIKILLADVVNGKTHKMDIKSRNKLLEKMTEDVANKVLSNNYQQALALSVAEFQAPDNLQDHEEFIKYLEQERGVNRNIESLPDEEDIDFRLKTGKGLTRPEIAVLLSYAKITFTQDLLAGNAPDQPYTQGWAMRYFPEILQKKYKAEIGRHRLRREIIATRIASSLVNRMGPGFVHGLMKATGENSETIAKAYIIALDVFALRDLWSGIEALDNKVLAEVQLKALNELSRLTDHAMAWFLNTFKGVTLDAKSVDQYCTGVASLRKQWPKVMTKAQKDAWSEKSKSWQNEGFPKALADQMAYIPMLTAACDIVHINLEKKTNLADTGAAYFDVGELFEMDWLRRKASYLSASTAWQGEAKYGLIDQLYDCQAGITAKILSEAKNTKGQAIVSGWHKNNAETIERFLPLLTKLQSEGTVDFAMLTIAAQRLQQLYGS